MAFLEEFFSGTPAQTTQVPRFGAGQQDLMKLILGQAGQGLDFGPIEEQARQGFAQKTVPTLAERFNKLGMGQTALTSPSFGTALGGAAAGLERDLAGMKSQRGMQLAQLGLTPQFENIYQPQQPSGLMQLLTALAPVLGAAGGSYMGNFGQMRGLQNLLSQFGNQGGTQQPQAQGGGFQLGPQLGALMGVQSGLNQLGY